MFSVLMQLAVIIAAGLIVSYLVYVFVGIINRIRGATLDKMLFAQVFMVYVVVSQLFWFGLNSFGIKTGPVLFLGFYIILLQFVVLVFHSKLGMRLGKAYLYGFFLVVLLVIAEVTSLFFVGTLLLLIDQGLSAVVHQAL